LATYENRGDEGGYIWDGGVAGSMSEGDADGETECEYVEIEVRDKEEQH
jgi:hypothetical protein